MVDDRVASSLGGLVMTQQLPLLLVAPTVVMAVAACEAAAFVLAEFGGKAQMDGMASGASVAWKAVAEEEKAAGARMHGWQSWNRIGPTLCFNNGKRCQKGSWWQRRRG